MGNKRLVALAVLLALSTTARADDKQSLEELRNTVVNLLEALVQRGVMTREQAEQMVTAAQDKAATDAKARAAQNEVEKDAVRVTYVPETVRQQIREEMRAEVTKDVTSNVIAMAKQDRWGLPGALPEWTQAVELYADVRARAQSDMYASDNAPNVYLDFNEVNDAGGIGRAAERALLNTAEDRHRGVGRLRFGARADVGNSFALDFRIASGNASSPVSTNQTLGNYGDRWDVTVDRAAVLWNPVSRTGFQEFDFRIGRFSNPFATMSELVWDNDLSFEGLSATYAINPFARSSARAQRGVFVSVGAFPLQEVELSNDDKWLYVGQLGSQLSFGENSFVQLAVAYQKYDNVTGVRNTFNSNLLDYTAPGFLQKGNTLFDIRNDADPATNLFALAGEYELATASLWVDLGLGPVNVGVGGEYVKNIGWDQDDVLTRTGALIDERTEGYDFGVSVGAAAVRALWDWRAGLSYRYLERDAVLDAFADSDFHLGGTDTKGYQFLFDLGLARGAWLRLRYLSANEIDGPPLGIDVWQLDFNAQF